MVWVQPEDVYLAMPVGLSEASVLNSQPLTGHDT